MKEINEGIITLAGPMEKWLNSSPSQGDIHEFESR